MTKGERAAVQRLLRVGRRFLEKGLPRDAADVFGRVLLKDPRRDSVRRGLARARRLAAEEERVHEARIAELRREPIDRSLLLARRRCKPGIPMTHALARRRRASASPVLHSVDVSSGSRRAIKASSRRTLVTCCAVLYAALLGVTALRWNSFVETLVRTPSPVGGETRLMTSLGRTRGELAVTEALRLAERGETASARSLLEMIPQADPAYPFSRHLSRRLMMRQVEP